MKKILITLTVVSNLFLGAGFVHAATQSIDQMVAIVNDDLITRSELNREIQAAKLLISQQGKDGSISNKSLEKQVLNQLINKKIQLQLAEQAGINIGNEDVDKAIQNIAAQNNVSVPELYSHIEQEGLSAANYRREIHDQIVLQKLQQHEVAGKITITPEEVTAFMKSDSFKQSGANEYRLQDILVPTSDEPSTQEIAAARTRAETILKQLQNGVSFSKLAQAESQGVNALQGGDLGWRKLPEIPTAFAQTIVSMKKNSLAGPIQTPNGFHILLLTDLRKLGSENKSLSDRKSVEAMLLQQKFEVAVQNWVSKLRSTAFISASV
jgi:peptidyl-prolyl cis-trans isomerase SurA